MKTVVCIKWGPKFSADYVNKLRNMVRRNLSLEHQFVCLTDDATGLNEGIEVRPLVENLEHSYTKLGLFANELHDLTGQILFLDLDVVIINPIAELFQFEPEAEFVSINDRFGRPDAYNGTDITLEGVVSDTDNDTINASCMRFEVGRYPYILENWYEAVATRFSKSEIVDSALKGRDLPVKYMYHDLVSFPPEVYRGDQKWTTKQLKEHNETITFYPTSWLQSYKYGYDMAAKVIVFHGLPKPADVTDVWVKENWC